MIPIGKVIVDHQHSVTVSSDVVVIKCWFWEVVFRSKNNSFDALIYNPGSEADFNVTIEDVMYKELQIGYVA